MYLPTRPVKTMLLLDVTRNLKTKFQFTIFYVFLTGITLSKLCLWLALSPHLMRTHKVIRSLESK